MVQGGGSSYLHEHGDRPQQQGGGGGFLGGGRGPWETRRTHSHFLLSCLIKQKGSAFPTTVRVISFVLNSIESIPISAIKQ